MTNNNMVVGQITQLTDNVPLNKARCRKCKEIYYAVELIGGLCDDCRDEIKRKERHDERNSENRNDERNDV